MYHLFMGCHLLYEPEEGSSIAVHFVNMDARTEQVILGIFYRSIYMMGIYGKEIKSFAWLDQFVSSLQTWQIILITAVLISDFGVFRLSIYMSHYTVFCSPNTQKSIWLWRNLRRRKGRMLLLSESARMLVIVTQASKDLRT